METTLYPSLIRPFDGRPGHRVVNMRLGGGRGRHARLEAVPACNVLTSGATLTPLCALGGKLIAADIENCLYTIDVDADSATPTGRHLPGEVLCAVATGNDGAVAMTHNGPARLAADGATVRVFDGAPSYPPVSLRAVQVGAVSTQVPRRKLSTTFTSEKKLSNADAVALTADYRSAYLRLAADASANAAFLQPVLACYRLLDRFGAVLFTSPPVLLSLPEVTQCAGPSEVLCDEATGYASAYDLVLKTWHIEVGLPSAQASDIAAVQVLVSPQFHPLSDGSGMCTLVRNEGVYKARVVLPGASAGIGVSVSGTETTLMAAVARMAAIAVPAMRIPAPFGGTARSVEVPFTAAADAAAAASTLRKALETSCAITAAEQVFLSPPHTFTAGCGATDGIAIAWGSPTVLRFGGYHPAIFATSVEDSAWTATVTVRFGNSRRVTRHFGGTTGAPITLGPVLSYPAPDAVSMSVTIAIGDSVRRFECPLTPDASGCRAVYVATDGQPIVPALVDDAEPEEECDDTVDLSGMIAIAPAHSPLVVETWVHGGCGAVRAIAAAPGSQQSWEVGRSRFIAACEGGVVSVSVPSAGGGHTTVRIVEPRGIDRPDALTAGPDRVYVLVDDVGGRRPIAINARGRSEGVAAPSDYKAMCYDRSRNELWLLRANGDCDVVCPQGIYMRSGQAPTAFYDVAGRCYGRLSGGLMCVGTAGTGAVAVAYADTASADETGCLWKPCTLQANIESPGLLVRLDVSAARLDGTARLLLLGRFISGAVRSPMTMRVPAAPTRCVGVRFEGMAAPGTIVESFTFFGTWKQK